MIRIQEHRAPESERWARCSPGSYWFAQSLGRPSSYTLISSTLSFLSYPEDGGRKFLRNVLYLPDCISSHPEESNRDKKRIIRIVIEESYIKSFTSLLIETEVARNMHKFWRKQGIHIQFFYSLKPCDNSWYIAWKLCWELLSGVCLIYRWPSLYVFLHVRDFIRRHEVHHSPIRVYGRSCRACPLSCARRFPDSNHHFDSVMSSHIPSPPCSAFVQNVSVLHVFDTRGDIQKRNLRG
jgi:hypothetical protein